MLVLAVCVVNERRALRSDCVVYRGAQHILTSVEWRSLERSSSLERRCQGAHQSVSYVDVVQCLSLDVLTTACTTTGLVSERELTFTFAICYRPSVCRLSVCLSSVVGNVRAPYSGGSNFRQYFYGIWYPSHPLTSTENFTEIVPGEPLRRGS